MDKIIAGKNVTVTDEGFLKDFGQWDKDIADALAVENQIVLTPRHWEVITYIQNEFKNDVPLSIRKIGKSGIVDICNKLGDWYRFLRGKVSSPAFKLICDLMTKNSLSSIPTAADVTLTPAKPRKQPTTSGDMRSLTIESKVHEK